MICFMLIQIIPHLQEHNNNVNSKNKNKNSGILFRGHKQS